MEKKFEVMPPTMPNFVRFKKEGVLGFGYKLDEGFDIASFTLDEAKEYAKLMHDAFLEHWRKRVELISKPMPLTNGKHHF